MARAAHDAWVLPSPRGAPRGLGHHVEATHTALAEAQTPRNSDLYDVNPLVEALCARTGYTPATTRTHLRRLARYGLATDTPVPRAVTSREALDAAAEMLGTTGRVAERARRYAAESAAWAAWCEELAHLRAPAVLGRARRTYPRTAEGRPDHTAARHTALAAAA